MMQGDACYLGIQIHNNAGNPVTPADIRDMEITLDTLKKTYTSGMLRYQDGLWLLPLDQRETLSLPGRSIRAQVRVCWRNGVVEGAPILGITLAETLSQEVL